MKYSKQQYEFICSLIWGSVPIDRALAEETSIFKTRAPEIIAKYPMLDKSFYEKMEDLWVNGKRVIKKFDVFDNWKKTIVFSGTEADCTKYLTGNNVYQMNYSKLKILKNEKTKIKSITQSEGVLLH